MPIPLSNAIIFNQCRHVTQLRMNRTLCYARPKRSMHAEIPVKEIRIPTPWGNLAAKLWGSGDQRPILALHGWQDNAGSYDRLAPMLAHLRPILAVDHPGHGLSDWYPKGTFYSLWDYPNQILSIMEHFKWDKVTFLCHSGSGIGATRFAGLFSNLVDAIIVLDNIVTSDFPGDVTVQITRDRIKKLHELELKESQPRLYTYEEMTKLYEALDYFTSESVDYILKRDIKAKDGKYYFTRDPRLKNVLYMREDVKFTKALVSNIGCPMLFIRAKSTPFINDKFMAELCELLREKNKDFHLVYVEGKHHVHLNEPEVIAPIVTEFLKKYRCVDGVIAKL